MAKGNLRRDEEKKVVEMYQPEKGYKAISKALGLQ
uniref:Uncharacterized protein n=1 Tax=Anguilla anguilla TaxID=7936 RepID=A0A0E9W1U4_ANGAN